MENLRSVRKTHLIWPYTFRRRPCSFRDIRVLYIWTILCYTCSSELAWRWSEKFHTLIFIHRQENQRSSNVKNFEMNQIWNRNIFRPPRISSEREVQHTWFIVVLIVAIFAFRTSYLELILELSFHALIENSNGLSILLPQSVHTFR